MLILIIEDDDIAASEIANVLEQSGINTVVAKSNKDLSELLGKYHFKSILIDCETESRMGIDVLAFLQATECKVRTVLLHNSRGNTDIHRGDMYMRKPANLETLLKIVSL